MHYQICSKISRLSSLRNAQGIKRDNLGARVITSYVRAICISCLTCRHTRYFLRKDVHKGRVAGSMTSRESYLIYVPARRGAAAAAAAACLPPEGKFARKLCRDCDNYLRTYTCTTRAMMNTERNDRECTAEIRASEAALIIVSRDTSISLYYRGHRSAHFTCMLQVALWSPKVVNNIN